MSAGVGSPTPHAAPEPGATWRLLGRLLVEQGVLAASDLEWALSVQRQTGQKLGEIVVEAGLVTKLALVRAIAEQLGVESPATYSALLERIEGQERSLSEIASRLEERRHKLHEAEVRLVERERRLGELESRMEEWVVAKPGAEGDEAARQVAAAVRLPFVDLRTCAVDRAAAALLPYEIARRCSALPIGLVQDSVVVAISDPTDREAVQAVGRGLARDVRFVVAERLALFDAMAAAYGCRY